MSVRKDEIKRMIDEIPEDEAKKVHDFISHLKAKRDRAMLNEMEKASTTSMDFWDNPIDDEVWNDA